MMCNRQNKLCPASGLQRNFSNTKGIHWLSPVMTSLVGSCWVAPARIPSPVVGAALQYCHETATVALQSGRCGVAPNLNPPNSELFEDGMRLRDLLLEKKHMLGLTLLFPSGSVCVCLIQCVSWSKVLPAGPDHIKIKLRPKMEYINKSISSIRTSLFWIS